MKWNDNGSNQKLTVLSGFKQTKLTHSKSFKCTDFNLICFVFFFLFQLKIRIRLIELKSVLMSL